MRHSIVIALFLGVVCAAFAEDKDPIKEKLFAAKVAYDKEMRQFRKQVEEWFNKREETARKTGDKKALDQLKEERESYEEDGDLPKSMPKTLQLTPDRAKKKLEAAYAEAVKAYIRAKKDDEAAAVEEAWKTFKEGGAINLLALVDLKKHSLAGDWKKDGKALVLTGGGVHGRLQFPYEPGEEYDLVVKCRRSAGDEGIFIGLVSGGRQVLAAIDGWAYSGAKSGLNCVDNKMATDNVTTVRGALLKSDTDLVFVYSVRSGKIDVTLNGKEVISFKGEFTRLSVEDHWGWPNKKALFLIAAPKNTYRFDRIVLMPVKGKGTILK